MLTANSINRLQRNTHYSRSYETARSSLTVGICAYTEVETTVRLVNTSLHSHLGQETRVVVVTPNRAIARRLTGRDSRINVILEHAREGKTSAMNKMLGAVRGGILAYASADIAVGDEVIPALVDMLLRNPRYGAVIAHVIPTNQTEGVMGRISSLIWELFNRTNQKLDEDSKLAQADDLYVFWRDLIGEIPERTINDDTYIAATIRKRGFLVKKAGVGVGVSGPTTPLDYVVQRSRIILGHLQTIKDQKVIPTVFEFTLLSSPLRNTRILVNTVASRGLRHCAAAVVASQLEFVSWAYALATKLLKRDVRIWRVAYTTKKILPNRRRHADS